uniref:G-protein coupled receptors family 1 profile domain-containing protein n=1 Tax=Ditylenchus dipsaci TaxID=166011 RepID=A0A915DR75_9BILA
MNRLEDLFTTEVELRFNMAINHSVVTIHEIRNEDFLMLIAISWVLYASAMLAAFLNLALVYITYKNRSLHKTYNILLAASAVTGIAHELGFNTTIFLLSKGQILTELLTCFYAQSYAVFGVTFSYTSLLVIAIDRLISVLLPVWHRKLGGFVYIFVLSLIVSGLFSIYMFAFAYIYARNHPKFMVVCMHSAVFIGYVGPFQFQSCLTFSIMTIFCYALIWILLRTKKSGDVKSTRRIFKSLVVILIVVFCGWTLNSIIELTCRYYTNTATQRFFVTRIGALLINLTSGSDLIILYFCSTDYKIVINREIAHMNYLVGRVCRGKSNSISTTITVNVYITKAG